jgi:hypothetical protein
MRKAIGGFPSPNCLFCCVEHGGRGPVGSRHGNRGVGWVVCHAGERVSPVLRNLRLARQWAEERYLIGGWGPPSKNNPYHHSYAIPLRPGGQAMIRPGCNLHAAPVTLVHASLKPIEGRLAEPGLKRECPVCGDGMLLMARDWQTGQLLDRDRCTLCAQAVIYSDIDELRKREGG